MLSFPKDELITVLGLMPNKNIDECDIKNIFDMCADEWYWDSDVSSMTLTVSHADKRDEFIRWLLNGERKV